MNNKDRNLLGRKWKNIKEDTREKLLLGSNAVDGITGDDMHKDGECIIDLNEYLSIGGCIIDGTIVIDDEARVYCPNEGSYLTAQQRWDLANDMCSKTYKLSRTLTEDFADACKLANVSASAQITKMMKQFIETQTR